MLKNPSAPSQDNNKEKKQVSFNFENQPRRHSRLEKAISLPHSKPYDLHVFVRKKEKSLEKVQIKKVGLNAAINEDNNFLSVHRPSRPSLSSGGNPMSENQLGLMRERESVMSHEFNFRDMTEDEIGIQQVAPSQH